LDSLFLIACSMSLKLPGITRIAVITSSWW
jgi:hypothetical protein